jgi:flagellar biosynthesis protein FlhF
VQQQTFRAADVSQALSAVKAALGPDAVITTTRHVGNGLGGGLGHSYVEVTASPGAPQGAWPFLSRFGDASRTAERRTAAAGPAARARSVDGPRTLAATSSETAEIQRELLALRSMLAELEASRPTKDRALGLLHAAGIEGPIARELAAGSGRAAKRGREALRAFLMERIAERIKLEPGLIRRQAPQLVACVGPTGVGKTTTLAKLAARARLDLGRSVAVISLDTFRVGAIEQWQRYAALMGVPFDVAHDRASFAELVRKSRAELLLVDTPGSSRGVDGSDLTACLDVLGPRELNVLLVLPAWLRGSDVENVAAQYKNPVPTGIVITKLDETCTVGGVLQAALQSELGLNYLCDGPRVPEDLHEPDPELLLTTLFTGQP